MLEVFYFILCFFFFWGGGAFRLYVGCWNIGFGGWGLWGGFINFGSPSILTGFVFPWEQAGFRV